MNELSYSAAETVSKDMCRSGTTGPGVDEVHLYGTANWDSDIIVDSERKSENQFISVRQPQSLRDKLTELKNRAQVLAIELFEN